MGDTDEPDTDEPEPLRRWAVTYLATASKTVIVEASTQEEAWELAETEFEHPQACYSCSSHFELGDWFPDESEHGTVDEGPA